MEENTIVIKNGNVEKEFTKLLEFKSDKTNKYYILYTDNSLINDKLNIFCSIVKRNSDDKIIFEELENDEDYIECNKAIDIYREKIKESN